MVERAKGKSEIMAIFNRYKNTPNDLIDNSDPESLDWLKSINKGLRNLPRSASSLMGLLEGSCLDKNI